MFSLICAWRNGQEKQWWGWRFETPLRSLWRHYNVTNDWWKTILSRYTRGKVSSLMLYVTYSWQWHFEYCSLWQWRHNQRDGVSKHQPYDCLLNRLFRRRSRKHQSSASLAFVRGVHRWPVNSLHKGPATRKMFPFDDVIMLYSCVQEVALWAVDAPKYAVATIELVFVGRVKLIHPCDKHIHPIEILCENIEL